MPLNYKYTDMEELVPGGKLTLTLQLVYQRGELIVNEGEEISVSATQEEPSITIRDAPAQHYFTLAMVDPDAMAKEWRHWLVVNIPGSDISAGQVVTPYKGPAPRVGTGLHRYIFLLYKQEDKITPEPLDNENKGRSRFNISEWAKRHSLQLEGATFFRVQRTEATQENSQ
jgi:phosphatidylethanolamine-binding protein (PEBP) family uncharacterized protein